MSFKSELEDFACSIGADLFGVADLTDRAAHDHVLWQGGEMLARFPKGISIGIRLVDAVIDELYRHDEPSPIYSYRGLYNSVNSDLDRVTLAIAKRIQEEGYSAYPIPASQTIDDRKLSGAVSHKLLANLSGLGWIGKNCLLITPEFGPRVRLASVFTDALLEAGVPIENRCGDCVDCVEICPPGAFTGVKFDPEEPRDVRFRANMCRNYTRQRAELLGEGICGLCVYVCPKGKKT